MSADTITPGWNLSLIDPGPSQAGIQVPVYGTPTIDPVTGESVAVIVGTEPGFHLNTVQSVIDACPAAAQYVVAPASPVTVWAGSPTVFLKLPDEATAKSVLAAYWTEATA
jgi:hypothetical protein